MSAKTNTIFVHDWLNGMRGGEKCLELMTAQYPGSPIYTLFYEKDKVCAEIALHPVRTSWLSRLPGAQKNYRRLLPLYPTAIESFRLPPCDLVLSMSHCVAKSINKPKRAVHVSYCFTPMRYAWGFFDEYFGRKDFFQKWTIRLMLRHLRDWDRASAARVDHFVAISQHIRERIKRCYARESEVIYPPVNTKFYEPDYRSKIEDFYLVVSALTPYKRVDLAVLAAKKMKKKLIVIGEGPERKRLEVLAGGSVEFMGWQPDEVLRDHYRRAKALLFPGEEDFGIVPVEAQACGCFVIAYGKGGALETVLRDETGVFFDELKMDSLSAAIQRFEGRSWNPDAPRKNAARFSNDRFIMEMKSMIQRISQNRIAR